MTSCVRGGGGVSKKLTKPDKGRRGGQPKTDKVDFLLNKKLLLCSKEPDMGGGGVSQKLTKPDKGGRGLKKG